MPKIKTNQIVNQMMQDLTSLGQQTFDIAKFDKKWTFKILTASEHLKTINNSSEYKDALARIFKMQIEVLKEALVSINDVVFEDSEKEELFNNVRPTIVNSLYDEYEKFNSEKEKELTSEDVPQKEEIK